MIESFKISIIFVKLNVAFESRLDKTRVKSFSFFNNINLKLCGE